MPDVTQPHRRPPARLAALYLAALSLTAIAATLLASATAYAQSAAPPTPAARAATTAAGPDLQGIWDFTMRVGDRTSPGFLAIGPVDGKWGGSVTLYLTNSLAIRPFTVEGDSIRMPVASREGDVRFLARLTDNGRTLEGYVEYHDGSHLPMKATLRPRPVVAR